MNYEKGFVYLFTKPIIMKKILLLLLAVLVILVIFLIIRTLTYPFKKNEASVEKAWNPVRNDIAVQHLSGGIRIPTVSTGELGDFDYAPFEKFKNYLKESYPLVYQNTENYEINTYALVFKIKGKNSSLAPILFLSHIDVVPPGDADVVNKNENVSQLNDKPAPRVSKVAKDWEYGPFSGAIANGKIYGRGTLDMKGMLFSLMESANNIIENKIIPERDIYLAFGFDEEVGGKKGATQIAAHFNKLGLKFDAVYDEGGLILEKGNVAGINNDVAVVGCAEKGFLSAKIKVKGLGDILLCHQQKVQLVKLRSLCSGLKKIR